MENFKRDNIWTVIVRGGYYMTEKEVIEAIKYMQKYQTETDKIEAKTAEIDCPKKCYDTISAFANKYGGLIIFGINEFSSSIFLGKSSFSCFM